MQSFWEYVSFVINSLVFLLIGMGVHVGALFHACRPVIFAIAAVLVGRVLSVYLLVPISNLFAKRIPLRGNIWPFGVACAALWHSLWL